MPLSTREAYGNALKTLGNQYDFWVMDADLSKATNTKVFAETYPNRFVNMGISEGDLMTTAAGIATCGQTVFASTFAVFATGRACEQVRNSIAYPSLNVKIAATHGGVLIGPDGGSHQAIEDIAIMRALPNMTVIVPCDEASTHQAVEASINHNGPVYLRFGRFPSDAVYTSSAAPFEIGKGNVLVDGNDVTLIAIGDMVSESLKAAEILKEKNINAAVIDMHTVKPIDKRLVVEYAQKTKGIVTAEDHNIIGGLGSAVSEVIAENPYAPVARIGLNDTYGRSGSRADLMEYFKLSGKDIADKAIALLARKR